MRRQSALGECERVVAPDIDGTGALSEVGFGASTSGYTLCAGVGVGVESGVASSIMCAGKGDIGRFSFKLGLKGGSGPKCACRWPPSRQIGRAHV